MPTSKFCRQSDDTYDRLDVCTNMLSSHLSFDKNQHAGTVPSPRIRIVGCEYTQGLPFDK